MINIAVEGESDRELAKAVAREAGQTVNLVRVAGGKNKLDPLIPKYNRASAQLPWVVFRDSDALCPVTLRQQLSAPVAKWHAQFILRIAHSMSEAWLLGDAEAFSKYFSIRPGRIPSAPEDLPHAKRTVLALCAQSRSRDIRQDMTAPDGGTGPLYVSRLNEFASSVWRPREAAIVSDSLRRAIKRISALPVQ